MPKLLREVVKKPDWARSKTPWEFSKKQKVEKVRNDKGSEHEKNFKADYVPVYDRKAHHHGNAPEAGAEDGSYGAAPELGEETVDESEKSSFKRKVSGEEKGQREKPTWRLRMKPASPRKTRSLDWDGGDKRGIYGVTSDDVLRQKGKVAKVGEETEQLDEKDTVGSPMWALKKWRHLRGTDVEKKPEAKPVAKTTKRKPVAKKAVKRKPPAALKKIKVKKKLKEEDELSEVSKGLLKRYVKGAEKDRENTYKKAGGEDKFWGWRRGSRKTKKGEAAKKKMDKREHWMRSARKKKAEMKTKGSHKVKWDELAGDREWDKYDK